MRNAYLECHSIRYYMNKSGVDFNAICEQSFVVNNNSLSRSEGVCHQVPNPLDNSCPFKSREMFISRDNTHSDSNILKLCQQSYHHQDVKSELP